MDAPATTARSRRWNRALTWVFLAALVAPTLDLIFKWDPYPSPLRDPVPFPSFRATASLRRLPGQLAWYLKESMGFRGSLVRTRASIAWSLGVSPAPESVVRADPWLFLRTERVIDDFRRVEPFTEAQLQGWRSTFEARAAWLAKRGSHYLIVVAPNKETVYADAVPRWFTRLPGPSRLEQLKQYLATTTNLDFLDLSATLMAHKTDARLYHFTDTHWNDNGAFVAYRAISERLEQWFPRIRTLDARDLTHEMQLTPGGDLARMCGLKRDRLEPQEWLSLSPTVIPSTFADGSPITFERMDVRGRQLFETRSPSGEVPSATILRDSFGEALIPYLSRHFQTATWIWTYDFPSELIDAQRPRLVIEELVERKLMVLEPTNSATVESSEGNTASDQ
ncbi:MAG TPA: hypothetical protein VH374_23045 [Polyangia bacterium]|jgi:hypothetical protein|nr:hypothetical protein [Polyangia bacterium]